ncbi:VQ motif-containing protein 25-like [Gastrolobium bilobum]|uniref:VQ motif-containing protein 25-like n=1 Tax=Gastrolobium bilobum TaxID=150636 RepID=UPI002AB2548C|nr:VQ motif-containing protein 25-like [Gastrolobium bilobum]
MTKLHTCYPSSASSKLGIDRDSHVISKFKPKIRIIHIYAPEIIKTDAANFRELVQRLTGKPEEEGGCGSKSKTALTKDPKDLHPKKAVVMEEDEEGFLSQQNGIRVKNEHEEEEVEDDDICKRSKSNEKFSGFFDGFSELDGFMEELSSMPLVNQN